MEEKKQNVDSGTGLIRIMREDEYEKFEKRAEILKQNIRIRNKVISLYFIRTFIRIKLRIIIRVLLHKIKEPFKLGFYLERIFKEKSKYNWDECEWNNQKDLDSKTREEIIGKLKVIVEKFYEVKRPETQEKVFNELFENVLVPVRVE
jgi:hypothetical protein